LAWNPYASFPWGPVIDGIHFDSHPAVLYKEGRVNQVPILGGANTDEGTLFVYTYYNTSMSETTYRKFVQGLLDHFNSSVKLTAAQMAQLYKLYPPSAGNGDNRALAAKMLTDVTFTCSTQQIAKDVSATGKVPFFLFRFDHRSGCWDNFLKNVPGVFHSSELDYVFYTPLTQFCIWSKAERQLSIRMQTLWANFAKNLTPVSQLDQDASGSDQFPSYDVSTRRSLVLRAPADAVEEDYRGDYCHFWKEALYEKLEGTPMLIV
jgi:para-nitrobenzyl esterase